ncbi:MAG TPA: hypothetical protein VFN50_03255 [Acidimicrobiales bacterium]|nr:hypothetical protein [Acidimicrobiales bacterium]
MNTTESAGDPRLVAAFHAALAREGLAVLAVLVALLVAARLVRVSAYRAAIGAGGAPAGPVAGRSQGAEPPARRLVRLAFGMLWLLDGLLQAQASMPGRFVPVVVRPTAAASPAFARRVTSFATSTWLHHPVTAAAAVVWIQAGLGLWLLVAARGRWSRLGGAAGALWALVVWVFGESFGGIFATGASGLFGAPGAALFYLLAGVLLALSEGAFVTERLGRLLLRLLGADLLAVAVLQAWPGRGFWHSGTRGTLPAMVHAMSATLQPGPVSSMLDSFASFAAAHEPAVNAVAVAGFGLLGAACVTARARVVAWAGVPGTAFLLATWVLVQDFGVLGGVGTDPNSMLPLLVLGAAGYLGLVRPAAHRAPPRSDGAPGGLLEGLRWRAARDPSALLRNIAAGAALAVVLLGAVPMAVVALEPPPSVPGAQPAATTRDASPASSRHQLRAPSQAGAHVPWRSPSPRHGQR